MFLTGHIISPQNRALLIRGTGEWILDRQLIGYPQTVAVNRAAIINE